VALGFKNEITWFRNTSPLAFASMLECTGRFERFIHSLKETYPNCLIPWFDGAIYSLEWKEALWDKFVMVAPRPRTPSEQQYSDRKLRTRR
jgi:hypothetical protein